MLASDDSRAEVSIIALQQSKCIATGTHQMGIPNDAAIKGILVTVEYSQESMANGSKDFRVQLTKDGVNLVGTS